MTDQWLIDQIREAEHTRHPEDEVPADVLGIVIARCPECSPERIQHLVERLLNEP